VLLATESVWQLDNLCRSWLQPRHETRKFNAASAAEVQILCFAPRTLQIIRSNSIMQMTWNLTDFRAWWTSSARYHWLRAMRLRPARDLTNFGDLR
jgi:hypothetical protein